MYRLLIVEDELIVRRGIQQLIDYQAIGICHVYDADNGETAWELFQQYQPEIVLTDINLPRINGIELAQRIKALAPTTHIIFLTGYDYFDYAVSAVKLGAEDYLLKPISRKELESCFIQTLQTLRQEERIERLTQIASEQEQEPTPQSNWQTIVRERLNQRDLSLNLLAQEYGFNVAYLSTLLKKELGMSFQDFVFKERMELAKILLLSSQKKIYEVAQAVGYEDVNYFSSRFKQYVGLTPKAYRKGVSEG